MSTITGTNGPETLLGGNDPDTINGLGGNDILTGSGGADTLTGGTGVDIFRDTAAGLAGDRITDFSPGDRIQLTDLTLANANIQIAGTTISYTGGSIQIDGLSAGRYVIRGIANNGGVEIRFQSNAQNDFNGDGRSDILWRHDNGAFTDWLGLQNGGFSPNASNILEVVNTQWQIAGTGDFNGDGRMDVLWHRADGALTDWLGTGSGGFSPNGANELEVVDPQWQIAATGDFNADGKDDILWRRADGAMTNWLGTANGSFSPNAANMLTVVDPQWRIAGAGDFNGDGKDDILWRNVDGRITSWLGTDTGGFADNVANAYNGVSLDWHIAGIGDFNGDGRDDILWRNDSGRITDWLSNANGGFVANSANFDTSIDSSWHVATVGDFNGDASDDILFRNTDGRMMDWLANANNSFTDNSANSLTTVDTHWHLQPQELFM